MSAPHAEGAGPEVPGPQVLRRLETLLLDDAFGEGMRSGLA